MQKKFIKLMEGKKPTSEPDYTQANRREFIQEQFWWKQFKETGLHRSRKVEQRFKDYMRKGLEASNNE